MSNRPLEGIRVVDLSRVFAMPYCGAYLADLGAEVIKIDTHHSQFVDTTRTLNGPYPDNEPGEEYWEQAGTFHSLNRGKLSLSLDLRSDAALEVLKNLVAVSDVVLENFTPRVMRRFGLDYPSLKSHRPDLIMASNTGYGHSGPWSNFGAMATALEPTHGGGAFMGYLELDAELDAEPDAQGRLRPGSVPNKIANSYTDFLASWTAQLAVLASLYHRAKTGQGTWIDLAMYQVGVSFIGEGLLDFGFNQRRDRRLGNRHEFLSPHGCYPCQGKDEWVVIAVRDDVEWRAFCQALHLPELSDSAKFYDPMVRYQNQDELDALISDWTSSRSPFDVMALLQNAGVPCGAALNAKQLLADPHLRNRGYFESVDHPAESGLGRREYVSRGWKLSHAEVGIRKPAPRLGEDNDYVLSQVLGLSRPDIDQLYRSNAVGQKLQGAQTPTVVPLEEQAELGWIANYDPEYRQFLSDVVNPDVVDTERQPGH